jgi:Uma2 family endonuclease
MTADQFKTFVYGEKPWRIWTELVRGEVAERLPRTRPMAFLVASFSRLLGNHLHAAKRGILVPRCGVILARNPDTVRVPDVAVYDDDATFAELGAGYAETPPLLAVLITHPEELVDLTRIEDFLRAGTKIVWAVDAVWRSVSVHRLGTTADHSTTLLGEEVLPGFKCDVGEFFRLPGEPIAPPSVPPPLLPPFPPASSPA